LKKPARSVRFRFYKPKTKKIRTESKPKKPSKKKRVKPIWTGFCSKKRTEPNRNRFWLVFFLNLVWLLFFIKTESNRKWSPLSWRTRHSFPGGKRKEKKMMLARHQRFSDYTSHIVRERRLRPIKWHSKIKIFTIKTSRTL
jgi:hypothetical protein